MKVAIYGALGRVGRRLCILSLRDKQCELVGILTHDKDVNLGKNFKDVETCFEASNCELKIHSSLKQLKDKPDCVIDFSKPKGTIKIIQECAENSIPIVIGTTGFTEEEKEITYLNESFLNKIPILYSRNFSLGITLMTQILSLISPILHSNDFDAEIIEAHHNLKIDAPSGTAKQLAESIKDSIEKSRKEEGKETKRKEGEMEFVMSREGIIGERKSNEIGIQSIRLGKTIGEHTAIYASEYERMEITHKALDRDLFAKGAIVAAKWLFKHHKQPGFYDMKNVLFEKLETVL